MFSSSKPLLLSESPIKIGPRPSSSISAREIGPPHRRHSKVVRPSEYQSFSRPRRTRLSPHRHLSTVRSGQRTYRSDTALDCTGSPLSRSCLDGSHREVEAIVLLEARFACLRSAHKVKGALLDAAYGRPVVLRQLHVEVKSKVKVPANTRFTPGTPRGSSV